MTEEKSLDRWWKKLSLMDKRATKIFVDVICKEMDITDLGEVTGKEGEWVVVVKDKVVASDNDAGKMLRLSEKYPDEDVVVTKILYPNASFY